MSDRNAIKKEAVWTPSGWNSIRVRLSLTLITIATIVFSGFSVYNYFITKSEMEAELSRLTNFLSQQLSKSLIQPIWDFHDEMIREITESAMLEKQVWAIWVRNLGGYILYAKIRGQEWDHKQTREKLSGKYYVKTRKILYRGQTLGSVEIWLSPEIMKEKLEKDTLRMFLSIVILNIALVSAIFIGLRQSVILPVSHVAESVRAITSGDLDRSVSSKRKDEIGQLAADVELMRLAIRDLTHNLETKVMERTEQLQEARDALWGEMKLAKKIQTVLLPENPRIAEYDIAASIEPAEQIGGDYYDVISVGGCQWIVVGDVSGHGVTAGLVMMMTQTAIHTLLHNNPHVSPPQLLTVMNRVIYENIKKLGVSKHMTLLALAVEKNGNFSFAGLHEDILIWRLESKKVEVIETDGMWVGLEPDISAHLSVNTFHLAPGDCMVLFTDGITEAEDEDENLFGNEQLARTVERFGNQPVFEIHENILCTLAGYEKQDDRTLFIMKRVA